MIKSSFVRLFVGARQHQPCNYTVSMHLLNSRFLPGGRKKLRDGLEAHDTTLLFLQDYIDFTDQRKHKGKITFFKVRGDTPRTPRFIFK